ncbi:D-xylose ABC transporter substrate-binding protein [Alkalitalea saponilacus]|uniref:Substrate-binding protein domain-containing protein n=1 Tax=Alkalitalea saponilacus TaxID=889453 RepID=A0A1T5GVG8_9BACT|nr:substrate-binding domain-containing protein [Alkalitalea saponilacus]ASB48176.1 sugar ABC transporter substrate-binding protein [Alkalitalea saponilacus]SKC12442.1 substrate-binding protein domain-containing protein [Alkalitalea saponilacus]
MRGIILLFLSGFLMFGNSCSRDDSSYTIGFMNASADRTRFVREGNYMAERLKEMGHDVVITAAEDNDALQLAQGYELLEQGVDALVIVAVNGNTIAPLVRDARSRGVKVFAFNRMINNVSFDFFITGNNEQFAEFFSEAALSAKPRGNYVILGGDRFDRNGFEMMHHIQSLLQPHVQSGDVNLLYSTYIEGWNKARAKYEMQQVVDVFGREIDVVIACNDPMAMGAFEVLRENDAHHGVVITGQGGYLDVVQSIYRNEINMTIYHPLQEIGQQTAEMVIRILNGEDPANIATSNVFNGEAYIPAVNFSSVKITRGNIEEILINSGEFSWSDIR